MDKAYQIQAIDRLDWPAGMDDDLRMSITQTAYPEGRICTVIFGNNDNGSVWVTPQHMARAIRFQAKFNEREDECLEFYAEGFIHGDITRYELWDLENIIFMKTGGYQSRVIYKHPQFSCGTFLLTKIDKTLVEQRRLHRQSKKKNYLLRYEGKDVGRFGSTGSALEYANAHADDHQPVVNIDDSVKTSELPDKYRESKG